jgi:peptidoglycan/xylan/chitin deacetylase (PgdA/CDA1 family)
MSLLVLMYHRARGGPRGNSQPMLDAHFAHVATHTVNVLPGDTLARDRLNVCLSFDDGYYDFWSVVFPLLRKHGLRAVLAVPSGYVRESVDVSDQERMNISSEAAFAQPSLGGFCVWPELETMARSGHVEIAAHGYTHTRLDRAGADFETEITIPQTVLSTRLGRPVNTFVFPYGRFSDAALRQAKTSYRHVFRIGSASNRDWNGPVTYRVDADGLTDPAELFKWGRLAWYRSRYWWNRWRKR